MRKIFALLSIVLLAGCLQGRTFIKESTFTRENVKFLDGVIDETVEVYGVNDMPSRYYHVSYTDPISEELFYLMIDEIETQFSDSSISSQVGEMSQDGSAIIPGQSVELVDNRITEMILERKIVYVLHEGEFSEEGKCRLIWYESGKIYQISSTAPDINDCSLVLELFSQYN